MIYLLVVSQNVLVPASSTGQVHFETSYQKIKAFLGMADIGINITGSIGHPKSNCLYCTENNRVFPFMSLHSVRSWRNSLYSAGV